MRISAAALRRPAVNSLRFRTGKRPLPTDTHAEPGDMIAIIGKGHEDYQEINGVRYPFLDRAVVEEVVKNL